MADVRWNPGRYEQFDRERAQPFFDLVARIDVASPRRVVDLGCGAGTMTRTLAERWPDAEVVGYDSSDDMLDAARRADSPANLHFEKLAIEDWMPGPTDDVVVTNAALQWVPTHVSLLPAWLRALPDGGVFALQVPGNFASPSHTLLRELTQSPRWAALLGSVFVRDADAVETAAGYLTLALDAGLRGEAWQTEYLHVLPGDDAVLDWSRGTRLRPVLSALSESEGAEFEAAYAASLRRAYPRGAHGTIYPFLRHFLVASKP